MWLLYTQDLLRWENAWPGAFTSEKQEFQFEITRKERTMVLNEMLKEKRQDILRITERYGARDVRVFDSVPRNEADEKGDFDNSTDWFILFR
ncbi:MAG: hypothetical protein HYU36_18930 [Planctomycetes bacterium]|nr:hypothetical protein [Planctomycetota bacterium]